ncbi:hypothetical protein RRG08_008957 [Elysia crispata]|uniref:Uncharacterized protein n=1 Tax=Elysia crispata TaxID=231223 RepID=A0AAE1AHW2_9GAST|nr:hypothetical protein RRG08_008957 [Elysia crispata]
MSYHSQVVSKSFYKSGGTPTWANRKRRCATEEADMRNSAPLSNQAQRLIFRWQYVGCILYLFGISCNAQWCYCAAEGYVTCINNLIGLPRQSYKEVYLDQLKLWMRRLKLKCDAERRRYHWINGLQKEN